MKKTAPKVNRGLISQLMAKNLTGILKKNAKTDKVGLLKKNRKIFKIYYFRKKIARGLVCLD
jgi:hypothetical protein